MARPPRSPSNGDLSERPSPSAEIETERTMPIERPDEDVPLMGGMSPAPDGLDPEHPVHDEMWDDLEIEDIERMTEEASESGFITKQGDGLGEDYGEEDDFDPDAGRREESEVDDSSR